MFIRFGFEIVLECDRELPLILALSPHSSLNRRILGPDAIVGHSTRGGEQLMAAAGEPVDYVSVGPVLPTATHPTRDPIGLDTLRDANEGSDGRVMAGYDELAEPIAAGTRTQGELKPRAS